MFVVSKIIGALIYPLNLIFVLLAAGLLLSRFLRRTGQTLIMAAFAIMLLFGVLPLGTDMLAALENKYERPAQIPADVAGIIVLGGMFDTGLSAARGTAALNDNAERILEGLRLARDYPAAILVFSGGEGRLLRRGEPEAEDAAAFLQMQGFAPDAAQYENRSRNTYENAAFTFEMLKPQPDQTWLLVTSAYHMPRAMAMFRKTGWPEGSVIPWPADYRTDGEFRLLPRRFHVEGSLNHTRVALHEYAGLLAYSFR